MGVCRGARSAPSRSHQHETEENLSMRHPNKRDNREDRDRSSGHRSYANIASTLALVVALGGGSAWAASHTHYRITSTSQIKPSVLMKLRGANGKNGTNGAHGATGATGATGVTGVTGVTGANGAVAGYYAATSSSTSFTGGTNTVILSKALPAGNYVLTGSVTFTASSTAATTQFDVACTLGDTGSAATDTSTYTGLTNFIVIIVPTNVNSLSMNVAVNATSASTARITCSDISNGGNSYSVSASNAALTAVQTTQNS
jgi:hypothetical protein